MPFEAPGCNLREKSVVDLGIEYISVFGLPPVQFVELAADLGCRYITTALQRSNAYNPHGYAKFSLREDNKLRREMIAVMRERGVSLSLGEGLAILENLDVRSAYGADLDLMRELGVPRINVVSLDPDLRRSFDQLAALAEMAANVGIETVVEFVPIFTISDLPTALAAIRHVGRRDCRVLIDTMHFGRSAARISDLAALDPELIGYVQLCDAPLVPVITDYMEEAMFERMVPGEGELPLREILAALPLNRVIGLEVPLRREAEAGVGPNKRMGRCVEAARTLLAQLPTTIGT
jgi:sugar phosphate isomerase/epimerase